MELSENAEEVLESLWIQAEEKHEGGLRLAQAGLSPDAPPVQELLDHGLVVLEGDDLKLTSQGRPEAERAVRRHRLAERLMADVLDTGDALMDESACRFEHLLRPELERRVCTLLGHPQLCPHGRPIPPGECCRRAPRGESRLVAPLNSLRPGQGGAIAYLSTQDHREFQKLMSMGILPGMVVRLIQDFPSFVFSIQHTQFAVDRELAGRIYVRMPDEAAPVSESPERHGWLAGLLSGRGRHRRRRA